MSGDVSDADTQMIRALNQQQVELTDDESQDSFQTEELEDYSPGVLDHQVSSELQNEEEED